VAATTNYDNFSANLRGKNRLSTTSLNDHNL
jgi:hypothetical protein